MLDDDDDDALAQLLTRTRQLPAGILTDRPGVIAKAEQLWHQDRPHLLNRVEFVGADFFSQAPPADVYFLRHVHPAGDAPGLRHEPG